MRKRSLKRTSAAIVMGTLVAALATVTTASTASEQASPAKNITISNVVVIPMTDGAQKIPNATVVIRDGRIISIKTGFLASFCKPNSECINGRGKWLIPGLTDSHVHIENDRMLQLYMNLPSKPEGAVATSDMGLPYVANGITQVFDLSAMSETFQQKSEIASGRAIGPKIITAFMIDGEKPILPEGMSHGVSNPAAGRQAVRDAFRDGYGIIKVYSLVDLETYLAIIDEAQKNEMRVIGHIPARGQGMISKFFVPGFDAVAHAEEFAMQTSVPDEGQIPAYVAMAKNSNTALITTLTLDDVILAQTENPESLKTRTDLAYQNPLLQMIVQNHNPYVAQASPERIEWLRKIVSFNRKLVKAFSDAGIAIIAGTDAAVPGVAPGFSMADELAALTTAGLTPYQALYSATRAPCEWLGSAAKCGTIAPGQRADLLLLDADPTQNIANIRRLSSVIIDGKIHTKAELDSKMENLKARFAAQIPQANQ